MNIEFENFKNQLINDCNNSKLPIGVIYYIFKDVMRDIEQSYNFALNEEHADKSNDNTNLTPEQ